jgi:hypothetical protein
MTFPIRHLLQEFGVFEEFLENQRQLTRTCSFKAPVETKGPLKRAKYPIATRRNLLHHQLERTYFDSADFALTAARKQSNIGAIQTGIDHPVVENISHPAAAAPGGSNVTDNRENDASKTTESTHPSHLNPEEHPDKDATNEKPKSRE